MTTPSSLYSLALASFCHADNLPLLKLHDGVLPVPGNILLDVLYAAYLQGDLEFVAKFLGDGDVAAFSGVVIRATAAGNKRDRLHRMFQAVVSGGYYRVRFDLVSSFAESVQRNQPKWVVETGLVVGTFFKEAGWYQEAEKVLTLALDLCIVESKNNSKEEWHLVDGTQIAAVLLGVQCIPWAVARAEKTLEISKSLMEKLKAKKPGSDLAFLFASFSFFYNLKGMYPQSMEWAMSALSGLNGSIDPGIAVDALCQAAKTCMSCLKFEQAGLVIKEAVMIARWRLGEGSLKYSEVLIDYAVYLRNMDLIDESILVFSMALEIRQSIFTSDNVKVAETHMLLADALMIADTAMNAFVAQRHAEKAMTMMTKLFPSNCPLLASFKRVKASVLVDASMFSNSRTKSTLKEAEKLHLSTMRLTKEACGEMSIETARYLTDLGRLYHSMGRNREAEDMQLLAIKMKEELLGYNNREVWLSLYYLAGLYISDAGELEKAKTLFLRCIEILQKFFDGSYFGLYCVYEGLVMACTRMGDTENAARYGRLSEACIVARHSANNREPLLTAGPPRKPGALDEFIDSFFKMEVEDAHKSQTGPTKLARDFSGEGTPDKVPRP